MLAMTAGLIALTACDDGLMVETTDEADSGPPNPARSACVSAVEDQTGIGDLTVLSTNTSLTETQVFVGVGDGPATWRCIAANDGTVEQVTSMVDEGLF
jgi:hypothetical protein